jgi:hypothetical protein
MRCPSCGTENAPDSRFCGGCGARLEPPRVAPTFKIPDDAAYPTPPPGSLNAIGHLPTPQPGSLQMPPQPRLGSIPPTNPAQAIPNSVHRAASRPPASIPPTDVPRPASAPPASIPPTDVQRPASAPPAVRTPPPIAEPSMSMPAAPQRSSALIAVVVIADLGLAAAGAALLFKGLHKPKAATVAPQKSEAAPTISPPAEPAPPPAEPKEAANKAAPKPAPVEPKEAAKKAPPKPATKPARKTGAPQDPYGDAVDLSEDVERMAAQSVGSFHNCLTQAIQTQPIHGTVRIAFLVEPDGRVDHAQAVVNTTGSDQLATCLAATIATWTLSPHPGPAASFERPFTYP